MELLVASAIALAVMGAVATLFGVYGSTVRNTEAIVALTDSLRSCGAKLRLDLAGTTVDPSRTTSPESATGYFEYIEGPRSDFNAGTAEADIDDVIMFTSRASGQWFAGRFTSVTGAGGTAVTTFESPDAEIAWFCKPAPAEEQKVVGVRLHRLYRRELLVAPYIGQPPFVTPGSPNVLSSAGLAPNLATLYLNYDLSLRNIGTAAAPIFAPNSLSDLSRREYRFLHSNTAFPFPFAGTADPAATFDGTSRDGDDIILGNVIGFDVRVFDPESMLVDSGGVSVQPGDPGYPPATSPLLAAATAQGAYVDLGWAGGAAVVVGGTFPPVGQTAFQGGGMRVSSAAVLSPATYDTWSQHYEYNGVNEGGGGVDEGTDGLDKNDNGSPDDPLERETSPPYPVPLRAIEVRIRCIEPVSKQIRQITVRHSFLR